MGNDLQHFLDQITNKSVGKDGKQSGELKHEPALNTGRGKSKQKRIDERPAGGIDPSHKTGAGIGRQQLENKSKN